MTFIRKTDSRSLLKPQGEVGDRLGHWGEKYILEYRTENLPDWSLYRTYRGISYIYGAHVHSNMKTELSTLINFISMINMANTHSTVPIRSTVALI